MKTLIIDALVGIGFPSMLLAGECEKVGLAYFTGNQSQPEWAWRLDVLEKIELEKLQELYTGLREARDELQAPP